MFNNITQSGTAEITGWDGHNIVSRMPLGVKDFRRKQVAEKGSKVTK